MDYIDKVCLIYFFQIHFFISYSYRIAIIPSSGVILERLQDVYLTSSSWTFVLNYEMDQFREDTIRLKELALKLELIYMPLSSDYLRFKKELGKVKSFMKSYLIDAEDLLHFLPDKPQRLKRGVFNVIGSLWKGHFGSATETDISDLQNQLEEVKREGKEVLTILEKHMTILLNTENKIKYNSNKLLEITSSFVNFTSYSASYSIKKTIPIYSHIASYFRELELTISEAKFQLVNLKAAIYSSTSGSLSSALLEPEKIEDILKNIEKSTRTPVTFPKIQTLERYSLARVSALATPSAFIFLISLPMSTPDSSFKAYLHHTYPVYQLDMESWIELDLERSVLLVSHDEMYYSVLPMLDYRNCVHDSMTICFNIHKVRNKNIPDCLYNIYNNSTNLCSYVMKEPVVKPYIERIQDSVIFSTDAKVTLNAMCPNMKFVPIEVNGHGIIRNIGYCTISSGYDKIFPSLIENIGNISHTPSLDIPSFDWSLPGITNSSDVLTVDIIDTKDALKDLRKETSGDVNVKLSSLLSYINERRHTRTRTQYIEYGTTAFFVFGGFIIMVLIFCGVCKCRKGYMRTENV